MIFGSVSMGYAGVVLWLMLLGQALFVLLSVFPIGRVVNWEVNELKFFPGFDFEKKHGGQNAVYQTCLESVQNHLDQRPARLLLGRVSQAASTGFDRSQDAEKNYLAVDVISLPREHPLLQPSMLRLHSRPSADHHRFESGEHSAQCRIWVLYC